MSVLQQGRWGGTRGGGKGEGRGEGGERGIRRGRECSCSGRGGGGNELWCVRAATSGGATTGAPGEGWRRLPPLLLRHPPPPLQGGGVPCGCQVLPPEPGALGATLTHRWRGTGHRGSSSRRQLPGSGGNSWSCQTRQPATAMARYPGLHQHRPGP